MNREIIINLNVGNQQLELGVTVTGQGKYKI